MGNGRMAFIDHPPAADSRAVRYSQAAKSAASKVRRVSGVEPVASTRRMAGHGFTVKAGGWDVAGELDRGIGTIPSGWPAAVS
jgi:hypothetical protein